MHGWWWPGRQVVVIVPCIVLALAAWAADPAGHRARLSSLAFAGLLGMAAFAWQAVEVLTGHHVLIVDFADTDFAPYRLWRLALPDFRHRNAATPWLALGWTMAFGALAAFGRRQAQPARLDDTAQPEPPTSPSMHSLLTPLSRSHQEDPFMTTLVRARIAAALVAVLAALGLAACGDDDGAGVRDITPTDETAAEAGSASASAVAPAGACTPVGQGVTATAVVELNLTEYTITADPSTVTAGSIHLEAHNVGHHHHEVVVVRGTTPAELPTRADGSFDEDAAPAGSVIGEIESFDAGLTCDGTFELDAGSYLLLCNLVEADPEASSGSHFQLGMVVPFTVTA